MYKFEDAKSVCEDAGGHLIEIISQQELDYLIENVARSFWLGAKRDAETGHWRWERTGALINMGLWSGFKDVGNETYVGKGPKT